MIRICIKRHAETRRFVDTKHRFHADEMGKAIKHAEYLRQTNYQVQIQAEANFYTGWQEVKTLINADNMLIH